MTDLSRRASFFSLTSEAGPEGSVDSVEIPLFQRDYAQGRDTERVRRIRSDFLEALHPALAGDDPTPVGLDFIYGGVYEGTLQPLDGQQRLTTLFLLHWYIASRAGDLSREQGWTRFSYATRQSARMFCESLVEHPLPSEAQAPSSWIEDQAWYLFVWRHDPTIQSMLVMLDAIDERFGDLDASRAWERLTNTDDPAIWFLLLPLAGLAGQSDDMRPEDLYIKMNSRGKPLTEFENLKAHLEKTIQWSPRCGEFALRVDTTWSDLLWGLRGEDDLIDDEFVRLLEFVTEVCEWREDRTDGAGEHLIERTRAVFSADNPNREQHLDFLFQALDVWTDRSITDTFQALFTGDDGADGDMSKVRLFFRQEGAETEPLNLFEACCRSYGEARGRNRIFSLGQTLIFYAVTLHLIEHTEHFPRRVRILRNLVEASDLRLERMPQILQDVHAVIRNGDLSSVEMLSQAQVEDEKRKASFLAEHGELEEVIFRLEDHELLRGSLVSFELSQADLGNRAGAFQRVMSAPDKWPDLLGALLAVGPYQRGRRQRKQWFLFGTSSKRYDNAWRELLTGRPYASLTSTREVLGAFLDRIAAAPTELSKTLATITATYLDECEAQKLFDWRYYMVKYPAMREGGSSTYFADLEEADADAAMGYSLCMLRAGRQELNGYYRDPYLLAISRELGDADVVEDKLFRYQGTERWLPLRHSGASIRCVTNGFELAPPPAGLFADEFAAACADLGIGESNVIAVPQAEVNGREIDVADRIQIGADAIRRLAHAGL